MKKRGMWRPSPIIKPSLRTMALVLFRLAARYSRCLRAEMKALSPQILFCSFCNAHEQGHLTSQEPPRTVAKASVAGGTLRGPVVQWHLGQPDGPSSSAAVPRHQHAGTVLFLHSWRAHAPGRLAHLNTAITPSTHSASVIRPLESWSSICRLSQEGAAQLSRKQCRPQNISPELRTRTRARLSVACPPGRWPPARPPARRRTRLSPGTPRGPPPRT